LENLTIAGAILKCGELGEVISAYFKQHLSGEIPARGSLTLSIDGKTLRGTIVAGAKQGAPQVLAILNNIVISTWRLGGIGNVAKARREWGFAFSRALITNFAIH
jgi:hypothetical protein